jgi:predicted nucleic acid-binding protein
VIVVDTNVVSELMRSSPSAGVVRWVRDRKPGELFTTAITIAEVLYGIARLPDGRPKTLLESTAKDVFTAFADQILAFDARAAQEYAAVVSVRERVGAPIDGFDAQIAAICRSHGATLATRNVKDFENTGVPVVDPWRVEQHPRA